MLTIIILIVVIVVLLCIIAFDIKFLASKDYDDFEDDDFENEYYREKDDYNNK